MDDIIKGKMLPIPSDCLPEYAEVIKRCWNLVPSKRPTFKETLAMLQFIYDQLTAEEVKKVESEVSSAVERVHSQEEIIPKVKEDDSDESFVQDEIGQGQGTELRKVSSDAESSPLQSPRDN